MSFDPKARELNLDVQAVCERIQAQLAKDPDHEVALAMYRADLRRAKEALHEHLRHPSVEDGAVRQYVDGRRVA